MAKELVLVITVGQTDLQFLVEDDRKKQVIRVSTDKNCTTEIHNRLLATDDTKIPYDIHFVEPADGPLKKKYRDDRRKFVVWNEECGQLECNGASIATKTENGLARAQIVFPLLHDVFRKLKRDVAHGTINLQYVLLLYTKRDGTVPIVAESEPIAAHEILGDWILTNLLEHDQNRLHMVKVLGPNDNLPQQVDFESLVHFKVSSRINEGIKRINEMDKRNQWDWNLYISGGVGYV